VIIGRWAASIILSGEARQFFHRPDQFEFIDGIFDLCRHARDLGYLIVVVTNQAGIGRGLYTEQAFHALTAWMKQQFAEQGIDIAAVYFCPHHALHGIGEYKRLCERRKPNPGMLLAAARELGIDLGASMLIGDKESDIEAGRRAGLGRVVRFGNCDSTHADLVIKNLFQGYTLLVETNVASAGAQ